MAKQKTNKLKVLSFTIKDVLGISEYAMEPGKVTLIAGDNAAGKTTVMKALDSILEGGDLAKLARIGKEGEEINPELVMVLESGAGQKFIVEKNTKTLKIKAQVGDSAGFEDVPSPARFLKGLYDNHMFSPVKFMNAPNYSKDKKPDRIRMLLGALPVELDRDKLWKDMAIKKGDIPPVPEGLHPLQELSLIRESIMRERKGLNRDLKNKKEAAEQIRRNTPAVLPDEHDKEIKALDKKISTSEKKLTERAEQAKSKCAVGCSEAKSGATEKANEETIKHEKWVSGKISEFNEWRNIKQAELALLVDKKEAELDDLIEEDKAQADTEVKKARDARDELTEAFQEERDGIVEKARTEYADLNSKRTKLTEMREAAKGAIKAKTLHDQAEQFDDQAHKLRKMAAKLTFAVDKLDERRRAMAENLPIKGLEVDGKEIKLDGIPYDQLNTAKQIKLAVQIACLRSEDQELPLVKVDGAEALGKENFDLFVKYLNEENAQSFIGKRTKGELTTTVVE